MVGGGRFLVAANSSLSSRTSSSTTARYHWDWPMTA